MSQRITASGLGLVVGSIGSSVVHNITFRDAYMYKVCIAAVQELWHLFTSYSIIARTNTFFLFQQTVKGIYMKTRWNDLPAADESVAR